MSSNNALRPLRAMPPPLPLAGVTLPTPPKPPHPMVQSFRIFSRKINGAVCALVLRESAWLQRWFPRWLWPSHYWPPQPMSTNLSYHEMPSVPMSRSSLWNRCIGLLHYVLRWWSEYYCAWYGDYYSPTIVPLPFGLILKCSDGTTFDEANAMMAVRAAGFPCPKVISVGEHPSSQTAPVSILMTRLPGEPFDEAYHDLPPNQREVIVEELKSLLDCMRQWKNPWGQRICSITGGSIRSIRVPGHRIDPCETEYELVDFLIAPASRLSFNSAEDYNQALRTAKTLRNVEHKIVFTHGDLALHNVHVYDGHITGFIDWESAGWYPEYWEFTTPLRWPARDREGGAMFRRLGGERYEEELKAELALRDLMVDSWISM